ncbi:hypothetical protein M409DRAFT_68751 [Zasmidium cellare ATCC 36951]|uniref:Myb-like domain-containing protein n=1 Tax=Zasmidium cellare ATCC 36951 TaxID=1080233 RepID=A0A6A6CA85_ZASCE|nr:uncharacterized protein M409DRAFT_68751 [Zasmidium cellare ATCC 36951]KAF2163140.1 hypothetical protein M409DRAFT_68751 [Zasmidium cellare ATCC 36951]
MPSGQDGAGSDAYRPTSIDYINLPNPIEPSQPQAGSQKHPLNGTPHLEKARLEKSSNSDLFKLILEPSSERPPKRQKTSENTTLDLPKLPVRNHTTKRLRIPPTLSGLHQPPPNAGLLPSISVEQPQVLPPRQPEPVIEPVLPKPTERKEDSSGARPTKPDDAPAPPPPKARQRRKWSDQETEDLLKGVANFGIGSWTKILNCEEYSFNQRTALDLKDRFRVCCPSSYKSLKALKASSSGDPGAQAKQSAKPKTTTKGPPREEISPSKLKELGINEPFVNVGRRNRHEYTTAEDEALLQGFKKHGNAWSTIRKDPDFGFSGRRAADLRDRFRTRYPVEYSKSVPSSSASSVAKRAVEDSAEKASGSESEVVTDAPKSTPSNKEDATTAKPAPTRRPPHLPFFSLDDVFLGGAFGDDDEENGEPIVLDRRILDWAGADAGKTSNAEASKSTGIDPLMTLKLPRPLSNNVLTALPSAPPASQNNSNSLPSLASVLPDNAYPDQIELPSLMQMIGSLDNDGRSGGGTFPSLEDLLS